MTSHGPVVSLNDLRWKSYFRQLRTRFIPEDKPATVVITHILPDKPRFVEALKDHTELRLVLPKPRSVDAAALAQLHEIGVATPETPLDRDKFLDPSYVLDVLETVASEQTLVLLDIGGYFAPSIKEVADRFSGTILGVVEDTENGHQRYEEIVRDIELRVYSVARSPLKDAEDHLVGKAVLFSTETLLRHQGDILHGRPACVVGYGKIGRSIANFLHQNQVRTRVFDTDPVRRTLAMAHGFASPSTLRESLLDAGLVICATGHAALSGDDFLELARGAYIASVTSSDDELDLEYLKSNYRQEAVADHVDRYSLEDNFVFLLNDGNAVNFLHGASAGPFIYLVQGELLAAVAALARGEGIGGVVNEVSRTDREFIASAWLDTYGH